MIQYTCQSLFTAILMKILHLYGNKANVAVFFLFLLLLCWCGIKSREKLNLIWWQPTYVHVHAHKSRLYLLAILYLFPLTEWALTFSHSLSHICKFYVKQKQNSIITTETDAYICAGWIYIWRVWVSVRMRKTSFSMLKLLMHIILNHHKFWDSYFLRSYTTATMYTLD